MPYSYLTPANIFKRYQSAKDYTDKLTKPFPEFSRIAKNKPVENLGSYPKVTDGTTAGIIRKTPRMAVQQLPTGLVEGENENDWLPIVAQFKYENEILPHMTQDYGLFEKSHLVMEGGLTFGAQATFTRFAKHDSGFSPDIELIYWGDLAIEKGKKSGPACCYVFYRTWWQKSDIEYLIDDEQARIDASNKRTADYKKAAKQYAADMLLFQEAVANGIEAPMPQEPAEPSPYEPTWDIGALKEVLTSTTSKDQQGRTATEDERGLDAEGIVLITGFQKGVGAKFYTFSPTAKKIVRTKVNKDPRGCIPISWFYGDIDGTNPLGRGIPEIIGSLQNLIDSRMQMATYVQAYATNPAVVQYMESDSDFEFTPNKLIKTNDLNFRVDTVDINTSALDNYIETQQYLQSQLYQLVASPHSNISSSTAVTTDGKTPTALNQQQNTIDIDINTVRKHFETWFEAVSECAINLEFAERSGKELLQLDQETADKLRKLTPTDDFDPNTAINEQNQIVIDYDTATPALKFRVDASSSKMQDNANQIKALELIQQFVENAPQIAQIMPPTKWAAIYNTVVSLAGVENPEDLKLTKEEQQQIEQALQMQQQAAAAQAQQQQMLQSQIPAGQQPAQSQQPTGNEVTQQHVDEFRQLGVPDEQIAQAIQMYNQQRGMANV